MKSRSMDGLRKQERSADFTGNRQAVMKHRRSGGVPLRAYRLLVTAIASAIRGIELFQRIAAGTQVLLAELVERRLHGAQVRMQIFRLGIDM